MVRHAKSAEADNHEKRAVELADQDDVDAVSRAMRCNTWTIRHMINKLRNLQVNVDEYRGGRVWRSCVLTSARPSRPLAASNPRASRSV